MAKIDIISGFLGAGKTTLIKKLLGEALKGQQVVLIENEFGEIGIDGGFLKDAGTSGANHGQQIIRAEHDRQQIKIRLLPQKICQFIELPSVRWNLPPVLSQIYNLI